MVVHAIALAVWALPDMRPARSPGPPGAGSAGASEPVAIVLLDSDASGGGGGGDGVAPSIGSAITTPGSGHPGGLVPGEAPRGNGVTHSPLMKMRSGPDLNMTLSPEFVANFLRNSKPPPPPEQLPEERIADELKEARKNHDWERVVALNEEKKHLDLKPSGGGTYRADKSGFRADVDRDGTVHLRDKPTFDATDRIMRAVGEDPYATEKERLLDRTRDERALIAKRYRHEQLSRAAIIMQKNIERLWTGTTELAARKRGLFELWDDCAEDGDDEVVAAAVQARLLLIGFIQSKLTGGEAYTADELAKLNAKRTSRAVFAPYAD